jgi:hypothetical protein
MSSPQASTLLKHLLGVLLILSAPLAWAQARSIVLPALGNTTAPVGGTWQFHTGDDLAWAAPSLDDSAWQPISVTATWGAQTTFPNHFSYTGFAWYRRRIDAPAVPGAASPLGIYLPRVEDAYEVYWNGVLVGSFGQMPPHSITYFGPPPHTFLLGPVRSGVLAIRVWKAPLESFATGQEGGLLGAPLIGSAPAIELTKTKYDFTWLHNRQYFFALNLLYAIVAVLAFIAWLNDRSQKLLFWIGVFCASPVLRMLLLTIRTPLPYAWALGIAQPFFSTSDIALWFILLYLCRLDAGPRLNRLTRILAWTSFLGACVDGLDTYLVDSANASSQGVGQLIDAILTTTFTTLELYALVLVAAVFVQRPKLNPARWAVVIFAFLFDGLGALIIALEQGRRFTHWTLDEKLSAPLFTIRGNHFTAAAIFALGLFLAMVYAVISFLREHLAEQSALQREFLSAQELQRVLVPESLPALPGYAVTSSYLPAQQVGGDFFQLIPLSGGDALLVLGDVSGKGLKAAMTVSLIIGTVRTLAEFVSDPAQILAGLNRRLDGRLNGGFVTCVLLRISPEGNCLIASAGHIPPILNGHELDLPPILPLGILPDTVFESVAFTLNFGDRLTLYTDGLLEARNPQGQLFGLDRVLALEAQLPDATAATRAAVDFGQDDDVTVLTLTRLAHGTRSTTTLNAPLLA